MAQSGVLEKDRIRCANMETQPRNVDIAELCGKCRPYTLGVAGRRGREREVEVLDGDGDGDVRSGEKDKDQNADLRGEGEKHDKAKDNTSSKSAGEGVGAKEHEAGMNNRWMGFSHKEIPSAGNGEAEIQAPPTFSVLRRVFGGFIPGSSFVPVKVEEDGELKAGGGVEGGRGEDRGNDGENKGKAKRKESWVNVEENPDWEVVEHDEEEY